MAEQSGSEPTVVVERRSGGGIGLFLLGVAVGAGIALLYAPQSGDETRQDLRRGARRLRRKARDLAEDAKDKAHEVVQTSRTAVRDAAHEAREALERRLARHGRAGEAEDGSGDGV